MLSAAWIRGAIRSLTRRGEDGAVTALVAVLVGSTLMVGICALVVDLGRARDVASGSQSAADAAALAAANSLANCTSATVATCLAGAVTEAKTYAKANFGGTGADFDTKWASGCPAPSSPWVRYSSGSTNCIAFDSVTSAPTKVLVVMPSQAVTGSFMGSLGASQLTVSRTAQAGLFSQIPALNLTPFCLPDGSPLGSTTLQSGGGGATAGGTIVTATPSPSVDPDWGTTNIVTGETRTVSVRLTTPTGLSSTVAPTVVFATSPNGSNPTNQNSTNGGVGKTAAWTFAGKWTSTVAGQDWYFTFAIGPNDVTKWNFSQWTSQAKFATTSGGTVFSVTRQNWNSQGGDSTPTVTDSPCPGSVSSPPTMGLFNSPRSTSDASTASVATANLANNVASDLNHQLTVLSPSTSGSCPSTTASPFFIDLPALWSRSLNASTPNCVVSYTNTDGGDALADGLVDGTTTAGRLNVANGATSSACIAAGRPSTLSLSGKSLNNDALSCYLINSGTLANLTVPRTTSQSAKLDPRVTSSPRFMWLTEVATSGTNRRITNFIPAFVTDETPSTSATSANGVVCNNTSTCTTITKLTVFTFDPSWLSLDGSDPVVGYSTAVGRRTWRLIN